MSFTQHNTNGLIYFTDDGISAAGGVAHGFSTRSGGVSEGAFDSLNLGLNRGDLPEHVLENHRRFCAALGADVERTVFSHQVHKDGVRVVTSADAGKGLYRERDYDADALVTDIPGLPLVVFTADCIPVLLYDPVRRVIGAVHAGWRGTSLGIAGKTVQLMQSHYGCQPGDLLAAIGPGISKCCFETREDVPNAMLEVFGPAAFPCLESLPSGSFRVDLKGLNALSLERAGLTPEQISTSDLCTACRPDLFWSHRITGEERGSLAALIQLC